MNSERKYRRLKAQSAMEYLMTYGWAILIIAVVLGALFSLGVFSGSSFLGNTCIPGSGYLCTLGTFAHGSATFTVTIGQSSGSWAANSFIAFAPQNAIMASGGIPNIASGSVATLSSSTFPAGSTQTVTLNSGQSAGSVGVGTTAAGSLWVCYGSTSPQPATLAFNALAGCSYVQIATLTIKAT